MSLVDAIFFVAINFPFLLQIDKNVRRTLSSVESGQHCRQGLWTREQFLEEYWEIGSVVNLDT